MTTTTQTLWHAGPDRIEALDRAIHLTDDRDAALAYLAGRAGYLHAVEVPESLTIADESDIFDAFEAVCEAPTARCRAWEAMEGEPLAVDRLRTEGFQAAAFSDAYEPDGDEDERVDHDTLLVWDPASAGLTITSVERIGA